MELSVKKLSDINIDLLIRSETGWIFDLQGKVMLF